MLALGRDTLLCYIATYIFYVKENENVIAFHEKSENDKC